MNQLSIEVRDCKTDGGVGWLQLTRWTPQEIAERIHTLLQSPDAQERRVVRERREWQKPRFGHTGGCVFDRSSQQAKLHYSSTDDACTVAGALNCVDELKWHAPGVDRRAGGVRERRAGGA